MEVTEGTPVKKAPKTNIPNKFDAREVQKSHLEFLYDLHKTGIPLAKDQYQLLVDNDLISKAPPPPKQFTGPLSTQTPDPKIKTNLKAKIKKRNKSRLVNQDVIQKNIYETDVTSDKELIYDIEEGVKKKDWAPVAITTHTKEFTHWIDSIRNGFRNRIVFEPFELYKLQAEEWEGDGHSVDDFEEEEQRYEYMIKELERCSINSLYAANKYYYLKDEVGETGKLKYHADDFFEHQRVCCYLFDCGYSIIMGKPRQPGITSIFGILGMNRVLNKRNYFLKFIAENKTTAEEIFEDKIKFSFESLEGWFKPQVGGKPDVVNDRDNLFKIGRRGAKGKIEGLNSKIVVTPPYKTAINGGSPPLVFVDEIGSIDILTEMINEGRPTMFRRNKKTGAFEIKGQICLWGTGTTGKGGGAFENEWKRVLGLWNDGDYTSGLIPLFFDWTTRCSDEEYLSQKAYYYGARAKDEGIDLSTSKVQFHQHYPSSPSDMFATTKKTIVDRETIDSALKRIYALDPVFRPKPGYFEPIYDHDKPMDENSDVPFKIIGAEFVPVDEMSDLGTCYMFQRPKHKWIDRYYQGTDPIAADTGTSRMASAIWDAHYNTVSCLVNHRKQNDPDSSFLQCLLMGIYYDARGRGVPEMIEKNIGLAYKKYKTTKGYLGNMMYNAELLKHLQSGSKSDIGLDNKGHRTRAIINEMYKVFSIFGEKIFIAVPFEQLKTFICTITRSGNETWGPVDNRYYYDDSIWAIVFSYIAAQSMVHRIPKNTEVEAKNKKIIYESYYDDQFNLKRRPVQVA